MAPPWALLAFLALFSFCSFPAAAAWPDCEDRDEIVERLEINWSERPVAAGVGWGGLLVEVFASREGETWSLVVTAANGRACMVSSGFHWQQKASPLHGRIL